MKKNKILITGADGFIGSHLTEELVKSGFNVKAFAFYNSFGSWGWLDHCDNEIKGKFEIIMGDIRDENSVRKAMKECNKVIHCASLIGIPYSYKSPASYVDTNIKGTLNILQAAKDFNISKIIHTSTSEVYGSVKKVPIKENFEVVGQSPYSASKIAADQLAISFYKSFNLPVTILRPFNTYGPRQSARAIIPTIITQCLNNNKNIKIGNLSPTRDLNYVSDTVSAFKLALTTNKKIYGEVINIGSGYEISIKNLIKLIFQLTNKNPLIVTDKKRIRKKESEVDRLCADYNKAKKLLNWKPIFKNHNGLKNGLKKTIEWFSNPENLKKYKSHIYNI